MLIAYELHMQPSSTTPHPSNYWKERRHIRVRRYRTGAATPELGDYGFAWEDGWRCRITAREVDAAEARRLRRASDGFAGYDWMVTSIEQHGRIQFPGKEAGMSTNYYHLAAPVKSLSVKAGVLLVELSDGSSFTLDYASAAETGFLYLLADRDGGDAAAPMRTLWGGDDTGTVVEERDRGLDPDLSLISESGALFTVAAIRARAGDGKKDAR